MFRKEGMDGKGRRMKGGQGGQPMFRKAMTINPGIKNFHKHSEEFSEGQQFYAEEGDSYNPQNIEYGKESDSRVMHSTAESGRDFARMQTMQSMTTGAKAGGIGGGVMQKEESLMNQMAKGGRKKEENTAAENEQINALDKEIEQIDESQVKIKGENISKLFMQNIQQITETVTG